MGFSILKNLLSRHGCIWITFVCFSIFGNHNSFAATQGQWGKTSSATAKITLIIPPKTAEQSTTVSPKNGFEALAAFCREQAGDVNAPTETNLYRFSLVGHNSTQLHTVLAKQCRGNNAPISRIKMSNQSGIATILVSPL